MEGEGENECDNNAECLESEEHLVCEDDACVVTEGAGDNECVNDSGCLEDNEYLGCEENACIVMEGDEDNQCLTDPDCDNISSSSSSSSSEESSSSSLAVSSSEFSSSEPGPGPGPGPGESSSSEASSEEPGPGPGPGPGESSSSETISVAISVASSEEPGPGPGPGQEESSSSATSSVSFLSRSVMLFLSESIYSLTTSVRFVLRFSASTISTCSTSPTSCKRAKFSDDVLSRCSLRILVIISIPSIALFVGKNIPWDVYKPAKIPRGPLGRSLSNTFSAIRCMIEIALLAPLGAIPSFSSSLPHALSARVEIKSTVINVICRFIQLFYTDLP